MPPLSSVKKEPRPNVLIFFTDQQRWDSCGCYGQKLPITPNLDEFASRGTRFEYAFSCQPVCGPVRAAIQTGMYPTSVGCWINKMMLPKDADTVAKRMQKAGYHCGYLGKWHLASSRPKGGADDFSTIPVPADRRGGWDQYWLAADCLEFTSHGYGGYVYDADGNKVEYDTDTHRVDALTDWTVKYMDTLPKDKPWFTFVSYLEPHHQNDSKHFEAPHGSKEKWKDYDIPGDLDFTEGDWRAEYPDYLGCCNALDIAFGRVLSKLKEINCVDNTVVIFTSDHACHFRTRNNEYKRSCHDNSIRIPMVVSGPGFSGGAGLSGGAVCKRFASNLDLPGTCLKVAGLKIPEHYHGGALQDILAGTLDRQDFLVQISEDKCARALRTPKWTYSVSAGGIPWGPQACAKCAETYYQDFLYDNETDPHQKFNLVQDEKKKEVLADLRRRLLDAIKAAGEEEPTIEESSPPRFVCECSVS